MAVAVVMPKLGLTMQEGTVTRWAVATGAAVVAGSPVLDISTDKIETEIEAEADGVLHHAVAEGAVVACGEVVAWLCAVGEAPPDEALAAAGATASGSYGPAPPGPPTSTPVGRILASPNARRRAGELEVALSAVVGTGPGGRIVSEDVEAAADAAVDASGGLPAATSRRSLISPVARRLAEQLGRDPATIVGTGPGGRVMLDDVLAAGAATPHFPLPPRGDQVVPMTGKRAVIAERMHASLSEMAQLTLTTDVVVDRLVKLRRALRDEWGEGAPGYTDFVVCSVARALRAHPRCNAMIRDGAIHELGGVHIGLAVALDDGLMVPVIRDADRRSLIDIAAESSRLSEAARSARLTLDELEGGTFSVTSLGAHGIDAFTPVVNPPNVAILGVGRIRDDVRWKSPKRPRRCAKMTLSLTIDHRALDGAPAAEFLTTIRTSLEAPHRLLVDA